MHDLVATKLFFIAITILATLTIRYFAKKEVRRSPEWWAGHGVAALTLLLAINETLHLVEFVRAGAGL